MVLEEDEEFVDVLLWGSTDMDQEPIPEPAQIIRDTTAIDIRAGFKFTAILTDDDLIYTTGDTEWWNINNEPVEDLVIWHELQNRNVTKIVCGSNFIAALTGDKKIYTWGTGKHGQLGLSEQILSQYPKHIVPVPSLIENLNDVVDIAAGNEFMAAVTEHGEVYTWGKGAFGVLGHGDELDCFVPTKIQILKDEHVVSVQCGTSHMACLTKDKEFFTWGNNFLGQLGRILQKNKETDFYPRLVELVQTGPIVSEETLSVSSKFEFIQIECLQFNTLALTKDGKLFSCGKGGSDGSGHGEQPHSLLCLIPDLPKITKIAASSTNHVAVIAENGDIYTWGSSEYGQLGLGDTTSQLFPQKMETLEGIKVLHISCGQTHTVAIVESLENLDEEEEEEEEMEEVDEGEVTTFEETGQKVDKEVSKQPIEKVEENVKDDDEEEEKTEQVNEASVETTTSTTTNNNTSTTKEMETKDTTEYKSASLDPDYTAPSSTKSTLSKDMDPYKVCGYLNKKGDKGIVKSWKKRWFQINEDVIGYYEQEDGKIKGTIVIKDILDVLPGQVKYGFNIVSSKKRVYELHAFTQNEKDIWCNALKKIISKKK